MLEIPESYTIARQLRETVIGKTISDVVAAQSPHGFAWYHGDPADYPDLLCSKKITDAIHVSGRVELVAGDVCLLINDGVNIRYIAQEDKLPKKHQLYIGFDDTTSLVCTVQMYGGMIAYPKGTYDDYYYKVALEKPSPLTDFFDVDYFQKILRQTDAKLSVKALLATEQRIPGLGNGCMQDILYMARVHPQSKITALDDADKNNLFHSVKNTLSAMAKAGGRDTEKDLFGNTGGYKTILSNKTWKFPCLNCGNPITRKAFLGGNVYFCPVCQPIKK